MTHLWVRRTLDAIARDWRRFDDPSYYIVSGVVFLVVAGILIFGGSPIFGVFVLLSAGFCLYRAARTLRRRP